MRDDSSGAPLTAGIDVGTQSVRVFLVEEDGRVVASGSAPLSSDRSDGTRHEKTPKNGGGPWARLRVRPPAPSEAGR